MYRQALGIEIGRLSQLADFDLSHPVVKRKIQERYGSEVPLEEVVISPSAMFEAANLVTVHEQ